MLCHTVLRMHRAGEPVLAVGSAAARPSPPALHRPPQELTSEPEAMTWQLGSRMAEEW